MQNRIPPAVCPIRSAVIYLQGAQVRREGVIALPPGEAVIVLEQLPADLLPDSIQAFLGGGGRILSVEHHINHMQEAGQSERDRELKRKLGDLRREQRRCRAMLEVCEEQEEMLRANRGMAGADTGLQAAELREGAAFFRECLEDIKFRRISLEDELTEAEENIQLIQAVLGAVDDERIPVSEITLRAFCEGGGEIPLRLTYFVANAGWTPSYEIRVRDTGSPLRLSCKGRVYQNTREDWKDVALTVSTASPSGRTLCPRLTPWRLDLAYPSSRGRASDLPLATAPMRGAADMEETLPMEAPAAPAPPMPSIDQNLTAVEYRISVPCTIRAGQETQVVDLATHKLEADYLYRCVRKLDREVYLVARVREYAKLNLVPGEAAIFFSDQYVGKTEIDPRKAEDEIEWSLGTDSAVVITRQEGKRFSSAGLGGNRKLTREWELTARNGKDHPIRIQLLDQIPVSQNKLIQVEAAELSGADHDRETGLLQWEIMLQPAEARSLRVRYVVTHPKNAAVWLD